MARTNKVTLIGNLGKDIEIHRFDNGGIIGNTSLATTDVYKNKAGEKVETTEWHLLKFIGKSAEIIEKHAPKGTLICVHGRLTYRKWEKDGTTHTVAEIKVEEFEFLGSKPKSDNNSNPNVPGVEYDDSDLPF